MVRPATFKPAMVKPQSILFVTLYLKGSSRLLTDKLRYVNRHKYRATILLLTGEIGSIEELPEGVRLLAGDYFSTFWRKIAGILLIARMSWRHDTVVGYSELTPTYMTALGCWMAFKRPFGMVHVHLSTLLRLGMRPHVHRRIVSLFYPLLRKVIGCSDAVAEDLRKEFGLRNVVSIPNSIDLDRVATMAHEELPEVFASMFDRPALVTIGMFGFQKGHDILLQAFQRVVEKGYPHNLIIVGSGNGRDGIEVLIRALKLESRVHLTGYVTNPYPLLRRADLFVLSSRFEGFAIVLAEAMALGVPIVSTDCDAGPREVLAGGRCGVLVPVDDSEALARGIVEVLSDPDLAERLRGLGLKEATRRDVKKWSQPFIDALV
jgi:glycosyltransferase involved in cell wall biosynthesis